MDENDYLQERVENQIQWYDTKSKWNQTWYKRYRNIEVIFSLLVPLVVGVVPEGHANKIATGIIGVIVAAVASMLNLNKFHENWIEYRSTAETLKHEKYLFLTRTGPYKIEEPFSIFVERIESLISKENTNWAQYIQKDNKEADKIG